MGLTKLTEKEKQAIRYNAKLELERLEAILEEQSTIQLLNEFKNKYNLCESVYKVVFREHQKHKGKKADNFLKVVMTQVPHALKFAGYDFEKELLNEIFGAKSLRGKTVKNLEI